ncbi:MAG: asparagine synthase (glutamine-hydrolyzing) [Tsuneonella sp.]
MCGIVGLIERSGPLDGGRELLVRMRDAMRTRGPDDAGEIARADGRVLMGHRRLAIIELSELGHQPMVSQDGRLTVVYNGEIYNHLELREKLVARGHRFRSGSDTETILVAYREYGTASFALLRGMFALALWDEDAGEVVLARDPHGIKPLYYRRTPGFAFASQVSALLVDPRTKRELDPAGLAGFAAWGAVTEPHTMIAGISALPAGHFMRISIDGEPGDPQPYLTVGQLFEQSAHGEAADPRTAIRDSVRHHMLADTEVGCFLSAGVDSGAILGMMRDCSPPSLRAITLRFAEYAGTARDESGLAAEVARRYGATHEIDTIDAADFVRSLPLILEAMDQPTIDGVNSWFVSRAAARAGLKVALSGLGGDELLGGYSTFRTVPQTLRLAQFARASGPLGAAARQVLRRYGRGKARHALDLGDTMPGAYVLRRGMALPDDAGDVLGADLAAARSQRYDPVAAAAPYAGGEDWDDISRVGLLESSLYMRNQLLRDSDWAGMAHSLEIRLPLVDATLTRQMARHLPAFRNGRGKEVLANAPDLALPRAVLERPKTGFGIPVARWIGGGNETKLAAGWARKVVEAYVERHRLSY